ncbi:MAG: hypothetical protein K2I95_05600 [Treponemataceae bacterium]|nr:hypothetical protein [Treponemataceae bacterium]
MVILSSLEKTSFSLGGSEIFVCTETVSAGTGGAISVLPALCFLEQAMNNKTTQIEKST